jgi:hypothetical protein
MLEIRTEIEISAPPAKVWKVLTDFNKWAAWNPIVSQASGEASLGSKLIIVMCGKVGEKGHRYMPVVTNLEEPKFFQWRAKMMAEFLFTNDKVFELQQTTSGTRLIQKEIFNGLLVPLFGSKFSDYVPSMLKSMNEALKVAVEKSSA